jgi:hypothetical protein
MDFADLPELETERLLLRKMRPDDAGPCSPAPPTPGSRVRDAQRSIEVFER